MARMGRSPPHAAADAPEGIAAMLARDFGAKTARARRGIEALTRRNDTAGQASSGTPAELARQTWFLLTVKLLTAEILAALAGRPSPAAQWRDADTAGGLRREVEALEHGPLIAQLRGGDGPGGDDPPAWHLDAWSAEIAQTVRELAAVVAEYPRAMIVGAAGGGHDLFKPLYEAVFPRTLRHALGEYYTPNWLAEHVLDQVGYPDQRGGRLLDPACGSGVFLMAAIRRPVRQHAPASRRRRSGRRRILENVVGLELNPLAAIDRPGQLPAGHRRSAAEPARGRDPRLPLRCDPRVAGQSAKDVPFGDEGHENATVPSAPLRVCCGQSALDRLGQSARGLSPGD